MSKEGIHLFASLIVHASHIRNVLIEGDEIDQDLGDLVDEMRGGIEDSFGKLCIKQSELGKTIIKGKDK